MSWNPFSRLGSGTKKPVISRTVEREFEKEVKKLEELDEVTKRLYKDGKRLVEANSALTKTERRLTQELLGTVLCQSEQDLRWQLEEWDHSLSALETQMQEVNGVLQKAVIEPIKKLNTIFPNVQAAVKRREQSLQELQKCQIKVSRYQERDRTGPNIVKLDAGKKVLVQAQNEFSSQNAALLEDMPKLHDSRVQYFQPSLEALIKSQVQYTTEALKLYGELSNTLNGQRDYSNQEYDASIQQALSEIKALSITVD
ncbi:bridging integrator 3-like [Littorina saxatilis]|uniref:BAR domain-containing protein n=1 Tax=Littorina saxatilis TaxID=31220 RepID=A0AAN9BSU2_9CAEN